MRHHTPARGRSPAPNPLFPQNVKNRSKKTHQIPLLPMIPQHFAHLYELNDLKDNYLGKHCDCSSVTKPIDQCPHLQDQNLRDYLLSLPQRLMILEKDSDFAEHGK